MPALPWPFSRAKRAAQSFHFFMRGKQVNKSELINAVADRLNESKARVSETIDAVFDVMSGALANGDDVRLPNFGVFDVKHTNERVARNPRTREEVKIPPGKKARFKPGKALKEALDGVAAH